LRPSPRVNFTVGPLVLARWRCTAKGIVATKLDERAAIDRVPPHVAVRALLERVDLRRRQVGVPTSNGVVEVDRLARGHCATSGAQRRSSAAARCCVKRGATPYHGPLQLLVMRHA